MEDIAKLIVGAWRLVHSVIIKADGKKNIPMEKMLSAISTTATPASWRCRSAGNPEPRSKIFRVLSTII